MFALGLQSRPSHETNALSVFLRHHQVDCNQNSNSLLFRIQRKEAGVQNDDPHPGNSFSTPSNSHDNFELLNPRFFGNRARRHRKNSYAFGT